MLILVFVNVARFYFTSGVTEHFTFCIMGELVYKKCKLNMLIVGVVTASFNRTIVFFI